MLTGHTEPCDSNNHSLPEDFTHMGTTYSIRMLSVHDSIPLSLYLHEWLLLVSSMAVVRESRCVCGGGGGDENSHSVSNLPFVPDFLGWISA